MADEQKVLFGLQFGLNLLERYLIPVADTQGVFLWGEKGDWFLALNLGLFT